MRTLKGILKFTMKTLSNANIAVIARTERITWFAMKEVTPVKNHFSVICVRNHLVTDQPLPHIQGPILENKNLSVIYVKRNFPKVNIGVFT